MAKLEELFKKYTEKTLSNRIQGKVINAKKDANIQFPIILELIKVEGQELLFRTQENPFKVKTETFPIIQPRMNEKGEIQYNNFFFWIEKDAYDFKSDEVNIHYMECSAIENFPETDIAYDDDIISQLAMGGKSATDLNEIPEILFNRFAFTSPNGKYLFIETFPNSDKNFIIHGLKHRIGIKIEDRKWLCHKMTNKSFANRWDDFQMLRIAKCKKISFVEKSSAREAWSSILTKEATSGNTILNLWKEYSSIEEKQANDFKRQLGTIQFSNAQQKKDGVTVIKLTMSEEQLDILKDNQEKFLASSFAIVDTDDKISFKKIDCHGNSATIINYDYPIAQGASGILEVDIRGNEAVKRRRDAALKKMEAYPCLVLANLRFAIEGEAKSMIPKERGYKALTDQTREFIKEKFDIDELTDDQKQAVEIAINTPDIAVIQGPPGTGKTTVVSAIAHRLMEIAKKEKSLDKAILVSAYQNDTVEHIASKIETYGLPTIKVGKEVSGVRAEEEFIDSMKKSIDCAIHKLAPQNHTRRLSKQLLELKALLAKENNADEVKAKIQNLINNSDISDELFETWKKIGKHSSGKDVDNAKIITGVKGLPTTRESYEDGGHKRIRKVLLSEVDLTEEERDFLNDAPRDDEEISDEFLKKLKEIKDKKLEELYASSNEIHSGVDIELTIWIDKAVEYFQKEEESSYADRDTFLIANLENLREELFGNTEYIRDAIQHYGQSVAATNQYAGSKAVNNASYENVILEEAARSNPLDLLIPMVRATERIIMVGDQFQLPHLLEKNILKEVLKDDENAAEKRKQYQKPIFGIIYDNLAEATPGRRITLTNQFRMHPFIGDFISKAYYNGELKSDLVNVEKKKHKLSLPWAKDKVAIFCDVPDGRETKTRSKSRLSEAKRIVELLDELKEDPEFDNLSVGIITFYSKQVEVIYKEAEKSRYAERQNDGTYRIVSAYQLTTDNREKLRIGTVDSFQGKEFDIVILSTVRSNEDERLDGNEQAVFGFLTFDNRLNVAFSRAQKMIVTVGDGKMFADEFAKNNVNGLYEFYTNLSQGEYGNRIK